MATNKPLSTRGRKFTGIVISDRMSKTVTVEWTGKKYLSKYERYEKKRSRVKAHNPDSISASKGHIVEIMETRPISKTKHFIITKIVGKLGAQDTEDYDATKKQKKKKVEEQ